MLDEYAQHVALLKPDSIAELVGDDCEPVDKSLCSLAGIVTSVTLKNTKNGDRMAFFTLEDRMAEIECIAFARQYKENSHLIHTDSALFVSGTVSVREDEPPKLLVNRIEALVEDRRFRPEEHANKKVGASTASLQPARTEPPKDQREQASPKRLFLRVPAQKSREFCHALNLLEIFDGAFPAYFYFADEKRYETEAHGVALSDYVLGELRALLGNENVILK